MQNNIFNTFADIDTKEIAPGFFSKLIHTDTNTINFIQVETGCSLPLHAHIHQQCSFVTEGRFEMTVGDDTRILDPGSFAIIPSNMLHGGKALTNCKLIDIFSPARDDYKNI